LSDALFTQRTYLGEVVNRRHKKWRRLMKVFARTIAAAAALSALAGAPALAQPDTFVFRVAETQLTSQNDAQRAYQRLDAEAVRYCQALDLGTSAMRAECRIDVIENVVQAVGDERLSAVHTDRVRTRTLADAG
jgi:UrcA family protein